MCKAIIEWLATVNFKDKHMFEHYKFIYNPTLIENLLNKFLEEGRGICKGYFIHIANIFFLCVF